jgi:hypothetical protein
LLVGGALIVIGGLFLLQNMGIIGHINMQNWWPLLLIAGGLLVLFGAFRRGSA